MSLTLFQHCSIFTWCWCSSVLFCFSTKIIIKNSSSGQIKPLQQTRTNLETNHSSPRGYQQMAFSVPEGLIVSPVQKCTRLQCVAPTLSTCAHSPGGQLKAPGGCRQLHRQADAVRPLTSSQLASAVAAYRCLGAGMFRSMCAPKMLAWKPTPPIPTNPHLHSFGRIKSEHLFRQLVSVTGGMQPVSWSDWEVWFVHRKAMRGDRVTTRLESGAG